MAELSLLLAVALFVYVLRLGSALERQKRMFDVLRDEYARMERLVGGLEQRIVALARQPAVQPGYITREADVAPNAAAEVTYVAPQPTLRQPEMPRWTPPAQVATAEAPRVGEDHAPVLARAASVPPQTEAARSFEHRVGANWLNRIGIALLVFGMAFFLAYQFTHMGAVGKVVTGLLIAGAVLGSGLWLEKKPAYAVFARAAIGGGWALLFFTLFAMHFVDATRVLQSELADLLLLFFAGVGMVAHSLRYKSQVVTSLAFLLAFSTVTISHQTLYSLLGSAVLALGLEIVCAREGWYVLEIAGIAAAYGNHFLWLSRTLDGEHGPGHPFAEFWPSTLVLLLFFVIFRIGYVLRRPADEQAEALSSAGAVLNAGIVLAVMRYQSFHPEWAFRALLAFGALEFAFAFWVRQRGRKSAFAVLTVIASVLVLAAVPFRYGGATWALLWVAEAEALWLAGFFTRERVMRLIGSVVLLATAIKLVLLDVIIAAPVHALPHRWEIVSTFALLSLAAWVNAEWLTGRVAQPGNGEDVEQAGSSALGAASLLLAVWIATDDWTTAMAWSAAAVLMFVAGDRLRRLRLRLLSYGALLVAVIRVLQYDFTSPEVRWLGMDERLLTAVVVMAACACVSERLRRLEPSLPPNEASWVGGGAATAASVVLSSLLYLELPVAWLAAGWAGLVLLQTAGALRRDGVRPRAQAQVLAVMVLLRLAVINTQTLAWQRWPAYVALAWLFAAVPLAFRLRAKPLSGEMGSLLPFQRPEQALFFVPLTGVLLLLWQEFHGGTLTMSVSALGVVVFLVALAVQERSFRLAGLGLLLASVVKLLLWDVWQMQTSERYLSLIGVGVALILVSFLYSRFADRLKRYL